MLAKFLSRHDGFEYIDIRGHLIKTSTLKFLMHASALLVVVSTLLLLLSRYVLTSFVASALNFGIISIAFNGYLALRLIFDKYYMERILSSYSSLGDTRMQLFLFSGVIATIFPLVILQAIVGVSWRVYSQAWIVSDIIAFFIYLQSTHVLSIITFLGLVIWLWRKYSNLWGAIIVTFFAIGVSEFITIPIHLIKWGNIFPWFWWWYLPFIVMMYPFIVARKHFKFEKRFPMALLATSVVELLVFLPFVQWTSAWVWELKYFSLNPLYVGKEFTFGMLLFELIGRVRRIANATAFSFIALIPPIAPPKKQTLITGQEKSMHPIDIGRMRVAMSYLEGKYGLNIGSGKVRLENKVNIDIVDNDKTDIDFLCNVLDMGMFCDSQFPEIVFTDVIEHLPKGEEVRALQQIERVLSKDGVLVLSTPYKSFWSVVLDPVWWAKGHRHYGFEEMKSFFSETNLKIKHIFTAGRFPFGVVTLSYAINWVLRREKIDLFRDLVIKAYREGDIGKKGATLYVVATK